MIQYKKKTYLGKPVYKGYLLKEYGDVLESSRIRKDKYGFGLTDNPKDTFQVKKFGVSSKRSFVLAKRIINYKAKGRKVNWEKVYRK